MRLTLYREPSDSLQTDGLLIAPPLKPLVTIEQPWNATPAHPYGVPFKSCVPAGLYTLVPFKRPNGQKVWCLVNESLGVYLTPQTDKRFRSLCLIHPGNTVEHTEGCILPGIERGILKGKRAVMKSGFRPGYAMDLMTSLLGSMSSGHELEIIPIGV